MRLIDADELVKRLMKERDLLTALDADWQRMNEIVRVIGIVQKMPTKKERRWFK